MSPRLRESLALLRAERRNTDVVVTTMGAAREWMALGAPHPLDLVLVPSAMGHATSWGLGLALARPDRRIVVVNGEGSMLMNLGSLVTITAVQPPNLSIVVCDNQGYEVTGGQPTPGASQGRRRADRVDFPAMARAAGFESVHYCGDRDAWINTLPVVLTGKGPVFILLEVELDPEARGPRSPGPTRERARAFMAAFSNTPAD